MYSREVNHFILLNTITYSILIVQLFHLTIYNYYILHHKSILLNLESRKILKQILDREDLVTNAYLELTSPEEYKKLMDNFKI